VSAEAAWAAFHDRMKAVGERITGADFPDDPRMRAEGYRYLARLQLFALQLYLESSDAVHPTFLRYGDDVLKWGAGNADNHYLRAPLDPAGTYRVSGHVRDVREMLLSVHDGEMVCGKTAVLVERSLADFTIGTGGSIEIVLGGPQRDGNWIPLDAAAAYLNVRQFVADWHADGIASLAIERVDAAGEAPPEPPSPAWVAAALDAAATWVETSAVFWNDYSRTMRAAMTDNVITPPGRPEGGAVNMLSGGCWFDLAPGAALLVECDAPKADYWSVQLYSPAWFEPLDYANRVTSLNAQQIHVDADGRFRVVVAHADPGVQNWLDTSGHRAGLLAYRWVRPADAPAPSSKVVALADVRAHLPATTPEFSRADRQAQIARRRTGIARRFRN
jgi:hypothetical protein